MGTVCVSNRTNQPIETGTFECILPSEFKPTEVKSNLVEVQEMCATKIQALFRGHSVRKQKKELEESFYPSPEVAIRTEQMPEVFHHVVSKVLLQLGPFDYSQCQSMVGAKTLPPYEFVGKGGIYQGQWKDHKRNGKGQYLFPDGSLYEGCWENDKANGYGRLIMTTGDYYIGDWKDDKNEGYGVYVHADKSRYEGHWKDDARHGQGKEIWSDESAIYDGHFIMGVKEGYGIYQWADGSNYEGSFKNGQFHGRGIYCWADGSKYDGEWSNNKMNGKGEMLWEDKRRYIGELQGQQKGRIWGILLARWQSIQRQLVKWIITW